MFPTFLAEKLQNSDPLSANPANMCECIPRTKNMQDTYRTGLQLNFAIFSRFSFLGTDKGKQYFVKVMSIFQQFTEEMKVIWKRVL